MESGWGQVAGVARVWLEGRRGGGTWGPTAFLDSLRWESTAEASIDRPQGEAAATRRSLTPNCFITA